MTDPAIRIKRTIAEQMVDGPCWIRSFQDVKPTLDAMVAADELVLVRPYNGVGRNMVGLSRKGAKRYGLTVRDDYLLEPPARVERPTRQKPSEHERELHKQYIAEVVSNGGSIKSCAAAIGRSKSYCGNLWREIVADMGPQAV